ncbi:hypothetical protein [Vibrio harveyi]|uniref:hypothetical protein n=1 Tax=Vibrio harveyi TaxID=669 RepID=UPI003CE9CD2F
MIDFSNEAQKISKKRGSDVAEFEWQAVLIWLMEENINLLAPVKTRKDILNFAKDVFENYAEFRNASYTKDEMTAVLEKMCERIESWLFIVKEKQYCIEFDKVINSEGVERLVAYVCYNGARISEMIDFKSLSSESVEQEFKKVFATKQGKERAIELMRLTQRT